MTFPIELCILLGVSVLISSVGLYRSAYFTTIGYGISIAACATMLLLLFHKEADGMLKAACVIMIVYGCRCAAYYLLRGKGNGAQVRNKGKKIKTDTDDMGVKIMLWVICGAVFALMMSPLCYRFTGSEKPDASLWIGVILMAVGLVFEWSAELGRMRRMSGGSSGGKGRKLYTFLGGSNIYGEIILWSGVMILGLTSLNTVGQWIVACTGYGGALLMSTRSA